MKSFHAVPESHAGADEKRDIKFQWPCFSLAGSCPDYPVNTLYVLKSIKAAETTGVISLLVVVIKNKQMKVRQAYSGADPGIFERGGPEAIIYKILERGGPKPLKMSFGCSFQSFSYKYFANISQKGGGGRGRPPGPLP